MPDLEGKVSKAEVGLLAALRSLIPAVIAILTAWQQGGIHSWKDVILPALCAFFGKGLFSMFTAKSIQLKDN